jgi:hypothetical protein
VATGAAETTGAITAAVTARAAGARGAAVATIAGGAADTPGARRPTGTTVAADTARAADRPHTAGAGIRNARAALATGTADPAVSAGTVCAPGPAGVAADTAGPGVAAAQARGTRRPGVTGPAVTAETTTTPGTRVTGRAGAAQQRSRRAAGPARTRIPAVAAAAAGPTGQPSTNTRRAIATGAARSAVTARAAGPAGAAYGRLVDPTGTGIATGTAVEPCKTSLPGRGLCATRGARAAGTTGSADPGHPE